MGLFRRATRLPAELAARVPRESPIAWSALREGGWLVLTAREWLRVPGEAGAEVERRGWHEVDHTEWIADATALRVRWIDGTTQTLGLVGDDPRLPQAVRERVEASIVHTAQRDLTGGVVVRAAVRRDGDGALTSQVSVVGAARTTPAVAEVAAALEAEVRTAVGLAP